MTTIDTRKKPIIINKINDICYEVNKKLMIRSVDNKSWFPEDMELTKREQYFFEKYLRLNQ